MLKFQGFKFNVGDWLARHELLCFVLMTLSFLGFGLFSLDLLRLVSANGAYLLASGWIGLLDGGLAQLLALSLSALAAMAAYLLFKLCEHVLVQRLAHSRH